MIPMLRDDICAKGWYMSEYMGKIGRQRAPVEWCYADKKCGV